MKEQYYYYEDNNKIGPYTKSEIQKLNLSKDTLIWVEGKSVWKKLSELKEFNLTEQNSLLNKGHIENPISLRPTRNELKIYIKWVFFHLFALIMTFTNIPLFDKFSLFGSNYIWPFSSILETFYINKKYGGIESKIIFNGFFKDYDFPTFLIYLFIPLLIFFPYKFLNPKFNFKLEGNLGNLVIASWLLNIFLFVLSLSRVFNYVGSGRVFWPFDYRFEIYNNYRYFSSILAGYGLKDLLFYSILSYLIYIMIRLFENPKKVIS